MKCWDLQLNCTTPTNMIAQWKYIIRWHHHQKHLLYIHDVVLDSFAMSLKNHSPHNRLMIKNPHLQIWIPKQLYCYTMWNYTRAYNNNFSNQTPRDHSISNALGLVIRSRCRDHAHWLGLCTLPSQIWGLFIFLQQGYTFDLKWATK